MALRKSNSITENHGSRSNILTSRDQKNNEKKGEDEDEDEDQNEEEKDDEKLEIVVSNTVNETMNDTIEEIKSGLSGIDKGIDFVKDHVNVGNDANEYKSNDGGNVIRFRENEWCKKLITFYMKDIRTDEANQIIGIEFTTNKNTHYLLGNNQLQSSEDRMQKMVASKIEDPMKYRKDGEHCGLCKIGCINDDNGFVSALSYT